MKKFLSLALLSLCSVVTAQTEAQIYSLEGRTEAVLVDGQPVLRILGKKGSSAEVKFKVRDNEPAFEFQVVKFPNSTGKLYVTKTKVTYDPDGGKARYYVVETNKIKEVKFHKLIGGFSTARIDDGDDKKPFFIAWSGGADKDSMHASTMFLIKTIKDFDSALIDFNKLTASVRPEEDKEDVPEEDTDAEVESRYDRFKDLTIVSTSRMPVRGKGRTIRSFAEYSFAGRIQRKADAVSLGFYVSSTRPVFREDDLELNFIVDGTRIPLGEMRVLSEVKTKTTTKQSIVIQVPLTTFEKIARGKSVEFQIGSLEYSMTDLHLETFRKLLEYRIE